jgi:hypothetical protein
VPPALRSAPPLCPGPAPGLHANFACTWRSYVYLLPLTDADLRALSDRKVGLPTPKFISPPGMRMPTAVLCPVSTYSAAQT